MWVTLRASANLLPGGPGVSAGCEPECGSQGRQPVPVPSTQHLLPPQTSQREHQEKPSMSHRRGVSETPNPRGSKNRVDPWVPAKTSGPDGGGRGVGRQG